MAAPARIQQDSASLLLRIDAVELALRSFARFEEEQQRREYLKDNLDIVPKFADNTESELKVEKRQLQDLLKGSLSPAITSAAPLPAIRPRRGAVFVLAYMPPNTFPALLGTAWAVRSQSMRLLLTAYDCLSLESVSFEALQQHLFVLDSVALNDDESVTLGETCVAVRAVQGDPVSGIAVLQAASALEEDIALCPLHAFPSGLNEDRVKTMHAPHWSFPAVMPAVGAMHTAYRKISIEARRHFLLLNRDEDNKHDSLGGVVVDVHGHAVAMICDGPVPRAQLPLPNGVWHALGECAGTLEGKNGHELCQAERCSRIV